MEAGSLGTGPGRCLFCRFWEDLFRLKSLLSGGTPKPDMLAFSPTPAPVATVAGR